MLSAIYNFVMAHDAVPLNFSSNSRNTVAEIPEMLKTGFSDNVLGITDF